MAGTAPEQGGLQADRVWAELAVAQVRPLVKEDARLQADRDMRALVLQLKVRCATTVGDEPRMDVLHWRSPWAEKGRHCHA